MVASGQLSDTRGPRPPLVAGLACFAGGLVLAGTATTMAQLVAGRVVQGLGGGLMITAVYVVIGQAYPRAAAAARCSPRPRRPGWCPRCVGPALAGALAAARQLALGVPRAGAVRACSARVLLVPVLRSLRRPGPHRGRAPRRPARAGGGRRGRRRGARAGRAAPDAPVAGAAPRSALVAAGLGAVARCCRPARSGCAAACAAPIALRGLLAGAFFGVEATIPLSLSVQHGYGADGGRPAAGRARASAGRSGRGGRAGPTTARGPHVRVRLIRAGFCCVAAGAGGMAVAVRARRRRAGSPTRPGSPPGSGAGLTMSSVGVLTAEVHHRRRPRRRLGRAAAVRRDRERAHDRAGRRAGRRRRPRHHRLHRRLRRPRPRDGRRSPSAARSRRRGRSRRRAHGGRPDRRAP